MVKKEKSLKNMLATKEDIKKLEGQVKEDIKKVGEQVNKNMLATKKLEGQVRTIKVDIKELDTKITTTGGKLLMEMDNLEEKMDDKMTLLRNGVAGMKDEIVGEIKAMREEYIAHQGVHNRHEETLENHEERITSLEQPKFT